MVNHHDPVVPSPQVRTALAPPQKPPRPVNGVPLLFGAFERPPRTCTMAEPLEFQKPSRCTAARVR